MLTVLMALFIVMFALSVVDKAKFEKFAQGMNGDLGNGASLLQGGPGLQQPGSTPVDLQSAIAALDEQHSRQQAAARERDELERHGRGSCRRSSPRACRTRSSSGSTSGAWSSRS
jgi:flagellar motor protein MotB